MDNKHATLNSPNMLCFIPAVKYGKIARTRAVTIVIRIGRKRGSYVSFLLTCLHEWRVVLSTRRPGALARPNVSPQVFQPGFSRSRNRCTCHPGNHADNQGTVEVEKRSSTLRRTCIFCCRRLVGVLVVCCCGRLDYGITARVTTSIVPNLRFTGVQQP